MGSRAHRQSEPLEGGRVGGRGVGGSGHKGQEDGVAGEEREHEEVPLIMVSMPLG